MKYLIALIFAATAFGQNPASDPKLPDAPGREQLQKACTTCHGLENVVRSRMTKEKWASVVDNMVSRGAQATDQEIEIIVNYLATNFGPVNNPQPPK